MKNEFLNMNNMAFNKFASLMAILAAIAGFLYSLSFIVIARSSPQLGGRAAFQRRDDRTLQASRSD
jgi:hypothetical protein